MAALQRTAVAVARGAGKTAAPMSTLAAFPYWQKENPSHLDLVCTNGVDVDLNYSLLPDGIVAGGDAWRNPSTQALLMYTDSAVTKNRAVVSGAEFGEVPNYATDVFDGMNVMDVGDFEDLDAAVKDDLYSRKRLFIHDGVVGGDRATQTRVRVVTDSADVALFAANMLHTTPLHNPETFPRNILVVANTQWTAGAPVAVSDVNPEAATSVKGTVVAAGGVPFQAIAQHIAHCAGQLATVAGWTSQPGGGAPALNAEATGTRALYVPDRHWRDTSGAAPDAVHVPASALVGPKGGVSLVFGAAADLPGAALKAGGKGATLVAAHNAVWGAEGVAAAWAGLTVPQAAAGGAKALPRGSVSAGGVASLPLAGPTLVPHPTQIVVVGGKTDVAGLAASLGEAAGAKFASRAEGVKVVSVKDAAAALAAAGKV